VYLWRIEGVCGFIMGRHRAACGISIEICPFRAGQDGHGDGGVARNLSLTLHLGGEERFPRGHGCGAACADPCARFSIDLTLF
jgi:hypothetical protein